jgi:hypothetical protein
MLSPFRHLKWVVPLAILETCLGGGTSGTIPAFLLLATPLALLRDGAKLGTLSMPRQFAGTKALSSSYPLEWSLLITLPLATLLTQCFAVTTFYLQKNPWSWSQHEVVLSPVVTSAVLTCLGSALAIRLGQKMDNWFTSTLLAAVIMVSAVVAHYGICLAAQFPRPSLYPLGLWFAYCALWLLVLLVPSILNSRQSA